jgi:hypothetical protein
MKPKHIIFYSWESDSPKETNLNAIRHALRDASSQLESEIDDTRIECDEATRDVSGSPNIPKTILDKIETSDIFICDLTTINTNVQKEYRRVPNPNVLIELGYAIATVGWERIIMLFNKVHGTFPDDLPFDIDRHRATPFTVKDKKDISGKIQLYSVLKDAIQSIIIKEPLKPYEIRKLTPDQRKRNVDVANLKRALSAIHIPTFDHFIEEIPQRIPAKIFYFKEWFVSILESNTFFIYEPELLIRLTNLKISWNKSLSFGENYGSDVTGTGRYYNYYIPMDIFPSEKSGDDFNKLVKIRTELEQNFKELIHFVRLNYLELDIEETSSIAFENYKNDMGKE